MANMMRELTILYHKKTALALTLGLVALMVSASFASGAYAQAGGHGGWLVGLIGNAHQILQGQVNKATSNVGQAVNQVTDSVTQANVKVLGHEAQLGPVVVNGIGFGVAAIIKFKAHKENPCQICGPH
jgi:hypothetical protein